MVDRLRWNAVESVTLMADMTDLSSTPADLLVPPWVEFPTYEKYSMGWRMGVGEDYIGEWWDFLNSLPIDYVSRLNYLQSHRPAPITWANTVMEVLYPESDTDLDESDTDLDESQILELLNLRLIDYDAAYQTWLSQQETIVFPWDYDDEPIDAARYWTRDFWFFSRQLSGMRGDGLVIKQIPKPWKRFEKQMLTGELGDVEAQQGLLTLAQMFCAGAVLPPWELGLKVEDFEDSFEMDMGYVDAYRLWMMNAFDDDRLLRQMLSTTGVPTSWEKWIDEQMIF